jgi:beta-N-acetylhexosaminidase
MRIGSLLLRAAAIAGVIAVFTVILLPTGSSSGKSAAQPHTSATLPLAKALGQLIIATYPAGVPPAAILQAVRAGQVGSIVLEAANTAPGVAGTRKAIGALQAAARAGHNPGLLIMTDQEGGQVKRLPGAPDHPAAEMTNPTVAYAQGVATANLLKSVGVNVDLAPVADVSRIDGFMTREQRTFGNTPSQVAGAACAFAHGLAAEGVAYTLKHFPGLGDATTNTDNGRVSVAESASHIYSDDLAYRQCGHGPLASVMISSASYRSLTGGAPAVLSPTIYNSVIPSDGITSLTMSDSFESGAINGLKSPAMTAINAGLDMVMYPVTETASAAAYPILLHDAQQGSLSPTRIAAAAQKVLALKRALGLA